MIPGNGDFIKYCLTIQSLSEESQKALRSICSDLSILRNNDLQSVGHTCKTIYFVKKGLLRIYYYKEDKEVTESFEWEGAFVARAESLFSGKPSRKAIQALENSELIAIDAVKLFLLFDKFPELERWFRKIMEQAYVNTVNRLESIQFHSADERYAQLLKEHPELLQRVPLKHIASYLGISAVSLSRIRAGVQGGRT